MKQCGKCGGFFPNELAFCPDDGGPLISAETPAPAQGGDPMIGRVVDRRYRVLDRLGAGGMGSVYRALQTSTRREVALKVIRPDVAADGTRRFMVEAQTTSALRSVHTVTIFDFGQDEDGLLYLAMELLEGRSLKAVAKGGPLPWERAAHIVSQIAGSLAEAHSKGIIHRDLKPANVFLIDMGGDPDFVKVLDFGIAKLQSGRTGLTGTGMVLGTPLYMAPEQARGQSLDNRADLYALGVVLFQLLVGRPPFVAPEPLAVMMQHLQEPVPSPVEVKPDLQAPDDLLALVAELMAKAPDERPESATVVQERLSALLATAKRPAVATGESGPTTPELNPASAASDEVEAQEGPSLPYEATALVSSADRASTPEETSETDATPGPSAALAPTPDPLLDTGGDLQPAGMPPRWPLAVAAAALVLALVVGGWWWQRDREESDAAPGSGASAGAADTGTRATAPAPSDAGAQQASAAPAPAPDLGPPAPARAPISLDAAPGPAKVYRADGSLLGVTPLEIPRPEQPLTVVFKRAGYRPVRHRLEPEQSEPVRVKLVRRRARPPVEPSDGTDAPLDDLMPLD